jgi:hypothetical protein
VSFDIAAIFSSTAIDGVILRASIGVLLGTVLLIAADLAAKRAPEGTAISNWWLVPIYLGYILTVVAGIKIASAIVTEFIPSGNSLVLAFIYDIVHIVVAMTVGFGFASLVQQGAINIGRKLAGFPPEPIDWPYVAAIRSWLSNRR